MRNRIDTFTRWHSDSLQQRLSEYPTSDCISMNSVNLQPKCFHLASYIFQLKFGEPGGGIEPCMAGFTADKVILIRAVFGGMCSTMVEPSICLIYLNTKVHIALSPVLLVVAQIEIQWQTVCPPPNFLQCYVKETVAFMDGSWLPFPALS